VVVQRIGYIKERGLSCLHFYSIYGFVS
jgi:hypothetical protein